MAVLKHILSRKVDTSIHCVWVDEEWCLARFPLFNLSGKIVGYQQYRPDKSKEPNNNPTEGRYFTKIFNKDIAVWGLESWTFSNTLFLTEGLFDAATLTCKGMSAIAVLSCDLSPSTKRWLSIVRAHRPVVSICDNDASGKKLAKYGHTSYTVLSAKDLNDASQDEVDSIIKKFC